MENATPLNCSQCNAELVENASFCSECGSQVSLKNRALSWGNRLKHKTRVTFDQLKTKMDHQISEYLRQFEQGEEVKIGNISVPENRKTGVMNAMKSFQDKYLDGDASQEADYEIWFADLSQRMKEHNCVVCFTKWDNSDLGNIVVCPHCSSGGHRNHISDWIKKKQYCPLCRETVTFKEYIVLT